MIYAVQNGTMSQISTGEFKNRDKKQYLLLLNHKQFPEIADILAIHESMREEFFSHGGSKFESHEGFDYMRINLPNPENLSDPPARVVIYMTQELLLFLCDHQIYDQFLEQLQKKPPEKVTLERILYAFFARLTENDGDFLERIEQDISELEEQLITERRKDCTKEIIQLRKQLMVLKRYYEQLFDLSGCIEENENHLLSKEILRYFRILTNRVDRLYHSVLNLRDYVTQVREAYQAQVDINLNSLMKLFTVITTIFLPLTLIVGWYGMNFAMPEYGWKFGYPTVILVSVAIVVVTICYFKRRKWF